MVRRRSVFPALFEEFEGRLGDGPVIPDPDEMPQQIFVHATRQVGEDEARGRVELPEHFPLFMIRHLLFQREFGDFHAPDDEAPLVQQGVEIPGASGRDPVSPPSVMAQPLQRIVADGAEESPVPVRRAAQQSCVLLARPVQPGNARR